MGERIETGGPAFPADSFAAQHCPGMSLRAWLAGLAMNGLLSANAMYGGKTDAYDLLARDAVEHGDAMLRALATPAGGEEGR